MSPGCLHVGTVLWRHAMGLSGLSVVFLFCMVQNLISSGLPRCVLLLQLRGAHVISTAGPKNQQFLKVMTHVKCSQLHDTSGMHPRILKSYACKLLAGSEGLIGLANWHVANGNA